MNKKILTIGGILVPVVIVVGLLFNVFSYKQPTFPQPSTPAQEDLFVGGADTGVVSCWKLDESSGNATDSVGSNTLTNVNTVTYSAGKINNGANLVSASSQRLTAGNVFQWQKGQAVSISLWVKLASTGNNSIFLSNRVDSTISGWEAGILSTGKLRFLLSNATSDGYTDTTADPGLSSGTFYHIVFTTSNFGVPSTYKIYVDAVSKALDAGSTHDGGTNTYVGGVFQVGARYVSPALFLNGELDEVGIWERELTSTEVDQLYNSGAGLACPFISTSTPSKPRRSIINGMYFKPENPVNFYA